MSSAEALSSVHPSPNPLILAPALVYGTVTKAAVQPRGGIAAGPPGSMERCRARQSAAPAGVRQRLAQQVAAAAAELGLHLRAQGVLGGHPGQLEGVLARVALAGHRDQVGQ